MPDTAQQPPSRRDASKGKESSVVAFPHSIQERPLYNLPLELSSFVGREREIGEVKRLLLQEDNSRLVTLTGSGGCGKTRLALAVAFEVLEDFEEGGVWWVELASLSDPALVPQAVASALKVREQPNRPLTEILVDALRSRRMLVVLDNCEHLIGACAELVDALLHACPNLRILATSREALGIGGESVWLVPSLLLPDPEHPPSVQELGRYEAVRLFVERAKAVASGFELTEENAKAVARVCRRLDGIPLAIELAAARARTLSAGQIAERLEDSLRLLTAGSRTATPRQQTLRATLTWGYELLSEPEGRLFDRLSVFVGGWTLEASEAVGAGGTIEREDVLDLLSHLVDKSMVVSEAGAEGASRYRMLEPVRQYAREKLKESGEAGQVRRRHAGWFVALAEEAEPHLKGHQQVAWLERLEREHDNLRAAMRWLLEEGEVETAVRLAWALWLFWYVHGHQVEGYRYAGEVMKEGGALPALVRAKALFVRAITSYGLESVERNKEFWEHSVGLFRQVGNDKIALAGALGGAGAAALQQGDTERAEAAFEEALTLYREMGNKWGAGAMLTQLGMIPFVRGDHERAVRCFEEGLALSREVGDRLISHMAVYRLALSSRIGGDQKRASQLYAEGLELAVEAGDKADAAHCMEGLAGLIAERGESERAARLLGASEALLETTGASHYADAQERVLYKRSVEALRSGLGETALEAARAEGRAMTLEEAIEYALGEAEQEESAPSSAAPDPSYPGGLSPREAEVLKLVAKGLTNAQIAKELFISPRTVHRHLNSIYSKLDVGSRAAATRFALEHDLA
jgi:predicted ATPase/DNA-binding CsgD family transcriptional regulator